MSEPRPVRPGEEDAFEHAAHAAFHDDVVDSDVALDRRTVERERTLIVEDGGEIVATTAVFSRMMTAPGGDAIPVAAVSAVGVRPGHTRRGHMGAMMRRQLEDVHAAGEAVAILWASDGAIYGRYGYGPATRRVTYEVATGRAAFRADVPLPEERGRLTEPAAALADMTAVYAAALPARPGMLSRDELWWERALYDPEHRREGAGARRAVVQPGPDGSPAGYALYAVTDGWDDEGSSAKLAVREMVAVTPEAHLGLWRFLLSVDLMRTVTYELAPDHEPIAYALRSTDVMKRRVRAHGLWVRLVDARAALAARAYSAPLDVVLELEDDVCPWNAGRLRLTADGCETTGAAPDLALGTEALASAYLGSTPLTALAAAGRVRELTPGSVRAASAAFGGFPEPYCPDHF